MRRSLPALMILAVPTLALGLGGVRAAPPATDGAAIYAGNCAACHQPHGEGVAGAFPKLAGNAFVGGSAPKVAALLTHGRGAMPSFAADLTNPQIAAVLTYVRSSWGNKAPPVSPAIVAASR